MSYMPVVILPSSGGTAPSCYDIDFHFHAFPRGELVGPDFADFLRACHFPGLYSSQLSSVPHS